MKSSLSLVMLSTITLSLGFSWSRTPVTIAPASGPFKQTPEPVETGKIDELIARLGSKSREERTRTENELLGLAARSLQTHRTIIDRLILRSEAMQLNRLQANSRDHFLVWLIANHLFQKLLATDAIDLLITNINYGDGYTGNGSDHYPGKDSLIILGADAVPQLSKALLINKDGWTRSQVALCLGNIGGAEAKLALEHALKTELDRDVGRYIEFSIATISREQSHTKGE